MSKSIFAFKKFSVKQEECCMKISTDSVLIGAWADAEKAKSILDIGTGCGVIALMLAQRTSAKIDAIDICRDSCAEAEGNFSKTDWSDRMKVYHTPLQEFNATKKYDLIISNPPFFYCPQTHKEKAGSQGRYTHMLSFAELAENVTRLLSPKGSFYVIFPVHEGAYFTNEAEKRKLFLNHYVWVKTTSRKKFPKRLLMKFNFSQHPDPEEQMIVIQSENKYTPEYKNLTKEYYLNF